MAWPSPSTGAGLPLARRGRRPPDPRPVRGPRGRAAVTERITLLTYLAVMPYRNPLLLAKSAASVDLISKGRFILGMGTGYLKSEFFALGVISKSATSSSMRPST